MGRLGNQECMKHICWTLSLASNDHLNQIKIPLVPSIHEADTDLCHGCQQTRRNICLDLGQIQYIMSSIIPIMLSPTKGQNDDMIVLIQKSDLEWMLFSRTYFKCTEEEQSLT